jgi:hypothetical protein
MALSDPNQSGRRRNRREFRSGCFKIFLNVAPEWFREFAESDCRHEFFNQTYSFCVVKGGRDGGTDNRIFEVFYGARPYDGVREINPDNPLSRPQLRLRVEQGAGLTYILTDRGTVLCFLKPARCEGFNRKEEHILLSHIRSTQHLTGKPALQRHFQYLLSYFEVSSLDGDPSLFDRAVVWWLLFTRSIQVEGKKVRARVWSTLEIAAFIFFTVGLNGFLLKALEMIFSKPPPPGSG